MKSFAATAALLLSAVSARSTPVRADVEARVPNAKYTILPTNLAIHSVNTGANVLSTATDTRRTNGLETSTLYEFYFDSSLAGLTCAGGFFSRAGDGVAGTGALDFFHTTISEPLADFHSGNLRDTPLGRLDYGGPGNAFTVDPNLPFPGANGIPCPAGVTFVIESVAVGEFDIVNAAQDFAGSWSPASGTPNGFSFVAY